ncbi:hypothetical protein [Viridibacillus arvi]|uniref:hypothetical protein n=1 Tax=Viridibacillus arvi TaxID=263475 RepID=UPI001B7FF2F7|nr:hypothetical protein [Viridibacillus arvi]
MKYQVGYITMDFKHLLPPTYYSDSRSERTSKLNIVSASINTAVIRKSKERYSF